MKALQLPFVRDKAQKVGQRMFRKQVLPIATVEHPKNGTLHFTPARLRALVERFKAGAYDTVPFLLADAENRHHDDIEKMRGEVKGLELTDEGLFADIETTDRGAKLLQDFPSLPVSVRLVPGREGAKDEALGHVLATLDPVIKGMKPWQAIEASAGVELTDLSELAFLPSGGGAHSATAMSTEAQTPAKDGQLSSDEVGAFRTFMSKLTGKDTEKDTKPEAEKADAAKTTEPKATEPTDAEIERVLAAALTETEPAEAEPVAATDTDKAAVELANGRINTLEATLNAERAERATERGNAAAQAYLQAGVPPAMVDLARPILTQPSVAPIELSNGEKHDPQAAIRKMLDAAKGTIELSERGAVVADEAEATQRRKDAEAAAQGWV